MERASGILLPISAIPSEYGIGGFSKEAYQFVDFLAEAGQKYWQILPLGPTGYGDSPYQSFSTYAGNPYYIDLEELIKNEWLTKEECAFYEVISHINYIEYEKIYHSRFQLLYLAYSRSNIGRNEEYQVFCEENLDWLEDYAFYMAVKDHFKSVSWTDWNEDIRNREDCAIKKYHDDLNETIDFYRFQQFLFFSQWKKLKAYANEKGIRILGDVPIYVAFDSADAWAQPKLFQFDSDGNALGVAGCPPDAFSETGQLWGNPLYNWQYHEQTGFTWWIKRIKHCFRLYDVLRIDHFRGFDEYYSIPPKDETAVNGHWEKGPGIKLFNRLNEALGHLDIIAEDLGFLTPSVYELLEATKYPGMKVLQFAFDLSENSTYLPHKYNENCIVYTGTHDNDTSEGWYETLNKAEKEFVNDYLGFDPGDKECFSYRMIRAAKASKAQLCVIPLQDYLSLGKEARINTPSTLGDNWKWRCSKDAYTVELAYRIRRLTKLYGR